MIDQKLKGKISLITGAGSGIGRSMAELFAEHGSIVVAVDVVEDRVKSIVEEIKGKYGPAAITGMVHDLSKKSQVDIMVDEALASHKRIDILCNNAGIMDKVTPVADTSDELWDLVLNINLNAPFRASRKVIPGMLERGGGVILNTTSAAGFVGGRAGAPYTVSKHGLIGLTRNVAAMYGSKGIRCNAIALGGVKTAIDVGGEPNPMGMQILNKSMATMTRLGDPDEVAKLALFLVSDDSSLLNGAVVVADAGWTVV